MTTIEGQETKQESGDERLRPEGQLLRRSIGAPVSAARLLDEGEGVSTYLWADALYPAAGEAEDGAACPFGPEQPNFSDGGKRGVGCLSSPQLWFRHSLQTDFCALTLQISGGKLMSQVYKQRTETLVP